MPVQRKAGSGLTDKLAEYGGVIKERLEDDPANLYAIQELSDMCQGDKKTRPHSHLIAVAVAALWLSDEVVMEYRGGKLLVGIKV